MVDFSVVQNTVSNILIRDDLQYSSGVITHYDSVENEDGEDILLFNNQEPVIGIVLDYTAKRLKYDSAGIYDGSSLIFLVKGTDVINIELDRINIENVNYRIVGIGAPIGGNYKIIQRLFLKEDTEVLPTT